MNAPTNATPSSATLQAIAQTALTPAQTLLKVVRALFEPHVPEVVVPYEGGEWIDVLKALRAAGYEPGWPRDYSLRASRRDEGCYCGLECTGCGSRGPHGIQAFQRGRLCRVIVRCVNCNMAQEV